jgi:hypothetical protein
MHVQASPDIDPKIILLGKTISWVFPPTLRQIKIVKPTRHPGEKQTSFEKQSCLYMLYGCEL